MRRREFIALLSGTAAARGMGPDRLGGEVVGHVPVVLFDHPRARMPKVPGHQHQRHSLHDGVAGPGMAQTVKRNVRVDLGAGDRFIPAVPQLACLRGWHFRLKATIFRCGRAKILLPESDSEASQVGGSERRGFGHGRADDGNSENIGLELHEAVVGGGSAVDSEFLHRVS